MSTLTLPPPEKLERICRGLAALDAILCEDWSYRFFSFNRSWSPTGRLASMRDGSGDEWFLVFTAGRLAFFKAHWHELPELAAPFAELPATLLEFANDAAFAVSPPTYGGWFDGSSWTLKGPARGPVESFAEQLAMLNGDAATYRTHASDYFEVEIPIEAGEHVLAGKPLDAGVLAELGSNRTLADLAGDLKEIGY